MRTCNKCGKQKDDSCFGKKHPHCKECKNNAQKARRAENVEYVRAYDRARYWFFRRSERTEYSKKYRETGGSCVKRKNTSYVKISSDSNPGIDITEDDFLKIRAKREAGKGGILYKIGKKLKDRVRRFVFFTKKNKWRDLIGADIKFVKSYLESKFTQEMNWDNHGSYWHIDHYIPVSHFDLGDELQIRMAFNWRNLRPLLASENLKKHASLPVDCDEFVEKLRISLDK